MLFNQADQLHFGPILEQQPNQMDIRQLPQFFRADADMVWRMGGPFLRHVLEAIPFTAGFKYVSIDTRTHMLFPRMYPSIPGWHCDDFYRPTDDQPDLAHVMEKAPSVHHCVIFGNTAFTEYIDEPLELPAPADLPNPDGKPSYGIYHRLIEERKPRIRAVQSGEVVRFSPLVFHRSVWATTRGWRYFFRMTESNHWQPMNEIRTQTQVYLTEAFYEW